ncbi:MAG: branched-chain amino acid ABC transporter permease [Dehalococcoidia bacterium]|nr:branched-chain amino acid ABC transporter permease [Dehalococcoidia bacterium]
MNICGPMGKRMVIGPETWRSWLPLLAGAGLMAAAPFVLSDFKVILLSEVVIFALFAVSYNLLLGYCGLVSFGHAALFGLGGYTLALLLAKTGAPFLAALVAAPVLGAAAALVMGFLALRLAQIYFALFTLAVGQIAWSVANKWVSFTNGDDSLAVAATSIPDPISSPGSVSLYFFIVAIVAAALLVLYLVVNSAFGYTLQAIRENPTRAEFVGVPVRHYRLLAFVISGFFAGLAGGLFAVHNHFVHPEMLFWLLGAQVLLMSLLGGVHLFWGPALGAGLVVYLRDSVQGVFPELTEKHLGQILTLEGLTLGAAALVVAIFFPLGVGGMLQRAARLATMRLGSRGNAPSEGQASGSPVLHGPVAAEEPRDRS